MKIKSLGIVTGDYVEFDEKALTVNKVVLPRKSCFIRPSVANVDAVNIVIASPPKPDYLMIDKLIISLMAQGVEVVLVVNKTDLGHDVYSDVKKNYGDIGCPIVSVSALTGEGVAEWKALLKGKLVAFAGQSAVGKSSLVNALFGLNLKTNDVSEKTQRGRHTTTVAQIYDMDDVRIVDTPGFSVIKPDISYRDLGLFYPEYFSRLQDCKYRGCTHSGEPGCAVKEAVDKGELCRDRYLRYKTIFDELKEEENNKY
ncbi:MAG: ribosome small subunit-dependent GTPase A [Clostridia bacterium]|nr:ribosome small subunit-dependent GTPase A [Clostridia bacterium]